MRCAASKAWPVSAQGQGSLSYQWSKNGRAIAGATSASYAVGAVAKADAGAYAASLGSMYNGRPRPPQVLLDDDGRLTLGRSKRAVG